MLCHRSRSALYPEVFLAMLLIPAIGSNDRAGAQETTPASSGDRTSENALGNRHSLGSRTPAARHDNRLNRQLYVGKGSILLQNGNVLTGKIRPIQNRYQIQIEGSNLEIAVEQHKIREIAPRITDLYRSLLQSVNQFGPGEHIFLANWCIDNQLLDEAGQHYQALATADRSNATVQGIKQRLHQALLADPQTRAAFGLPPKDEQFASTDKSDTHAHRQSHQTAEHSESPVRLAAAESSSAEPKDARLLIDEPLNAPGVILEQLANIDARGLEEFQSQVLPILHNRCGQTACHGNLTKTDLKIIKPEFLNRKNREVAIKSLLRYTTPSAPDSSRLAKMAGAVHGQMNKPALDLTNPQDRQLLDSIVQWQRHLLPTRAVQPAKFSQRLHGSAITEMSQTGSREAQEVLFAAPGTSAVQKFRQNQEIERIDGSPSQGAMRTEGRTNESAAVSDSEIQNLIQAIDSLEKKYASEQSTDPFSPDRFNAGQGG